MNLVGKHEKTIDFGLEGVNVSLGKYGDIILLSKFHPIQGYVSVCPFQQFSGGEDFYDQNIVRSYRKEPLNHFARHGSGYGLVLKNNNDFHNYNIKYKDGQFPEIHMSSSEVDCVQKYTISSNCIIQTLHISGKKSTTADVQVGGKFSLNRASYTQLTEANPIPIPQCQNDMSVTDDGTFSILNPNLPLKFQMKILQDGQQVSFPSEHRSNSLPIDWNKTVSVNLTSGQTVCFTAYYWVSDNLNDSYNIPTIQPRPTTWLEISTIRQFIVQRTFEYINGCCSIPVGEDSICLIADHVALPLGWNRDNYFQIRFLMDLYTKAEAYICTSQLDSFKQRIKTICLGHLKWVYKVASRPKGYWGRSYLTTGKCKDFNTFQLDQQCYPLIELCDYLSIWPQDTEEVKQFGPIIDEILNMLYKERKADNFWVFETEETPADDPVDAPYHFSSNILLWKSLVDLSYFKDELKLSTPVDEWASLMHKDILEQFTTTRFSKPIFSYVCDLKGNHILYQDANDIILAYAPKYKFIDAGDPRWLELMNFGFSGSNTKAYFPGLYGGLGSVHTKNSWPLGDCQELIYRRFINDTHREKSIWKKLEKVMQWDGSFGEAVDSNTGVVTSKHWFSWPGSAISSVILEDL